MNCPGCHEIMSEGAAQMHGTLLGFLSVGLSYQKLFFRAHEAKRSEEVSILASGERAKAYRCPKCGGVFIAQPPWVPGYK
jgi:hypothetical protein